MQQIHAPWTPDQVETLNRFQTGRIRPFECPDGHILEASGTGWRCSVLTCSYTQNWTYAFMADSALWSTSVDKAVDKPGGGGS